MAVISKKKISNFSVFTPEIVIKRKLRQWLIALVFAALTISMPQTAHGMESVDDKRPQEHYCPITREVMVHPVIISDGISYEREFIESYFKNPSRKNSQLLSPFGEPLANPNIIENTALKSLIQKWNTKGDDIEENWVDIPFEEELTVSPAIHDEPTPHNTLGMSFHFFSQIFGTSKVLGDSQFAICPAEIKLSIFKYAIIDSLDYVGIGELSIVCKEWQSVIKPHKREWQSVIKQRIGESFNWTNKQVFSSDEERFLNGMLIYDETIVLPISKLVSPWEGTFDLSKCGEAEKYLSISTGYRKMIKEENAKKIEIWLTPRLLVERAFNSLFFNDASHLKEIFPIKWSDKAAVGIFWTWGHYKLDCFDYLTCQKMEVLGTRDEYFEGTLNLYEEMHTNKTNFQGRNVNYIISSMNIEPCYMKMFRVYFPG